MSKKIKGTINVQAKPPGDVVVIIKQAQTITVGAMATRNYTTEPITLVASTSSGL